MYLHRLLLTEVIVGVSKGQRFSLTLPIFRCTGREIHKLMKKKIKQKNLHDLLNTSFLQKSIPHVLHTVQGRQNENKELN